MIYIKKQPNGLYLVLEDGMSLFIHSTRTSPTKSGKPMDFDYRDARRLYKRCINGDKYDNETRMWT
jgi:hypothetical protein